MSSSKSPVLPIRGRRSTPARGDAYHHGALRAALIDASESLLAERGLEGFSLREVARRSGVSPAAPAHHFGDAAGLLTAVATLAFDGLTEALEAGNARGGTDPIARLREQGVGYVGFALRHPGRFNLMFGPGLQMDDEALERSSRCAFSTLELALRDLYGLSKTQPLSANESAALLATWSVVHGFAHLALAGRLGLFKPEGGNEGLLQKTLAPMLDQQLSLYHAAGRHRAASAAKQKLLPKPRKTPKANKPAEPPKPSKPSKAKARKRLTPRA